MTRRILAAALAVAVAFPLVAGAQERERSRERDSRRARDRAPVRMFSFNRPRLGVTIQLKADEESDRYGARIVSVIEDGPADEAGLKAGDIITRFGSTSLAGVRAEGDDDVGDVSGPGRRLIELAQDLDQGDTVRVEYRRDGDTRTATIVAENLESEFSFHQFEGPNMVWGPRMEGMVLPKMEGPGHFEFFGDGDGMQLFTGPGHFLSGSYGLHLIEMNADLGEYFGTNEGLLVIRASQDSAIPLRAGDVILAIDGREPTSVAHALRIIGSYEEGETVKVDIMRKRQRSTVEWVVKNQSRSMLRSMRPSRVPLERVTPSRDRTRL
jgi:S1-C subfamily serine protease